VSTTPSLERALLATAFPYDQRERDAHGRTVVERELRCRQLLPFVAQLRPCLVGMEACGGAHYWAREIAKRGHEVRLRVRALYAHL
jgi:transposase